MIKYYYLLLTIVFLGKFSVFAQPRTLEDTRDPRSAPPRDARVDQSDARVDPRSAPPRDDRFDPRSAPP